MKSTIIASAIIVAAALLLSAGVVVIPGYAPVGTYQVDAVDVQNIWVINTRSGRVVSCYMSGTGPLAPRLLHLRLLRGRFNPPNDARLWARLKRGNRSSSLSPNPNLNASAIFRIAGVGPVRNRFVG